jgi:sugar/nucleoside kinase (ribokinase family)
LAVVVGDVINDIVVRPFGPPAAGTDTPSLIEQTGGGSGANQAAWMGALGAAVRFAGRAGAQDANAHRLRLAQAGVDARITADPTRPTGTIVVLVGADGERSMFTDRGASEVLDDDDLPADLLDGAELLHVSGYSLFSEASRAAVLRLWRLAVDAGLHVSVDPCSAAGLAEVGAEAFVEWTGEADTVFPNLDEGRLLAAVESPEPAAIVDRLLEHYRTVALKLGPSGVLAASRDGERVRLPGRPVDVVDSTGAGDAFCAGWLVEWLSGGPLAERARAGLAAAARAVTQVGGRPRP